MAKISNRESHNFLSVIAVLSNGMRFTFTSSYSGYKLSVSGPGNEVRNIDKEWYNATFKAFSAFCKLDNDMNTGEKMAALAEALKPADSLKELHAAILPLLGKAPEQPKAVVATRHFKEVNLEGQMPVRSTINEVVPQTAAQVNRALNVEGLTLAKVGTKFQFSYKGFTFVVPNAKSIRDFTLAQWVKIGTEFAAA